LTFRPNELSLGVTIGFSAFLRRFCSFQVNIVSLCVAFRGCFSPLYENFGREAAILIIGILFAPLAIPDSNPKRKRGRIWERQQGRIWRLTRGIAQPPCLRCGLVLGIAIQDHFPKAALPH